MLLSQKCQYALRALLELAKHPMHRPVKIHDIAAAQSIPPRFLENILSQLRQGKFVDSRRGKSGGYMLARKPSELTIGEIIRFLHGPIRVVDPSGPLANGAARAFEGIWEQAETALLEVFDRATFDMLVEEDRKLQESFIPGYSI